MTDRDDPWSVSQLTHDMRALLSDDYGDVWVRGEISQPRTPRSGHVYLTLKDEEAVLPAVIWRSALARMKTDPQEGTEVLVRGGIDVYPPHGRYQLIIRHMEPLGAGALQRAFDRLRRKLEVEGLFDEAAKRPLPPLPRRVGLVTSRTGAAVRDMVSVIRRRFPSVSILLVNTRVQGEGAGREVARAIAWADRRARLDVMIVGRGGGSIEDLWAFNEEVVARAMHAANTPIVSAVGHESDVTIADLVADVRAATPSQAGELVVPVRADLVAMLDRERRRLLRPMRVHVERAWQRLEALGDRRVLRDARALLQPRRTRWATLADRLRQASPAASLQRREQALRGLQARLMPPLTHRLVRATDRLDGVGQALHRAGPGRWSDGVRELEALRGRLRALSPLGVLRRGYSITFLGDQAVRAGGDVRAGDVLRTRLSDGAHVQSRVESVQASQEAEA